MEVKLISFLVSKKLCLKKINSKLSFFLETVAVSGLYYFSEVVPINNLFFIYCCELDGL